MVKIVRFTVYLYTPLLLGTIAYLWHSGYIHKDTLTEFRNRFVTNHSETKADGEAKPAAVTVEAAKPETEASATPLPDATTDVKPTETQPPEASPDDGPATAPPSKTAPAPKPATR